MVLRVEIKYKEQCQNSVERLLQLLYNRAWAFANVFYTSLTKLQPVVIITNSIHFEAFSCDRDCVHFISMFFILVNKSQRHEGESAAH